jgi:hypothetical protein
VLRSDDPIVNTFVATARAPVKPVFQYQTNRILVETRDVFVCIMSRNCYEPKDADRLDALLDQAYRSGKIAGIEYALDRVKNSLTD